jgi:phosphoribosylamine--glycine ligase
MKVLVIGGGAREHALCWRMAGSPQVSEVLCAPGNPGTASCARNLPIAVTAVDELVAAAQAERVALTIVGPEAALAVGVVDAFQNAGLAIAGPVQASAQLESSKAFAKEVMTSAGVPTAEYQTFTSRRALESYCKERGAPLVLKADGLASGKGVFVITDNSQFGDAINTLFSSLAADVVVVEEFLPGVEVSCIFASNGSEVIPLAPAHDYKRLGDNDSGPNTGGMGSICPTPRISESELNWIQESCAAPIIRIMAKRGTPFKGFLYAGLMVPLDPAKRPHGIKVLEYNTRLGDPECQAILCRLESDPFDLMSWIAGVKAEAPRLSWSANVSACVVIASDGYPEAPVKGDEVTGLELARIVPRTVIFHAGTVGGPRGTIETTGGRALSVVALGESVEAARSAAYKAVDMVQIRGRRLRRDIGL